MTWIQRRTWWIYFSHSGRWNQPKQETRCYKHMEGSVAKCCQMCRCGSQNKHHYLLVHLFGGLTQTIENNKSGPAQHWTDNLTATMHLQLFANNRNSCSLLVVWYSVRNTTDGFHILPPLTSVTSGFFFLCQTVAEHW